MVSTEPAAGLPKPPTTPNIAIPLASSNHSEATKPDQRGTEQSPFVVKVMPSQETNPPTDKHANGTEITAEDRIADYTRQLTWVTGFLGLVTAGLVYIGIRQEKHFVRIERPYVFYGDVKQTKLGLNGREFQPIFMNVGKTAAIVIGTRLQIAPMSEPPIPQTAKEKKIPRGAFISANAQWPRGKVTMPIHFQPAAKDTVKYYLFGEITYLDVFQKEHRTWFCRVWDGAQFILGNLTSEKLNGYT